MKNERLRLLTEAGIFLAMGVVLEYLTLFIPKLPQGGKLISLGMIPLLTFALLRGPFWGILMGVAMGIIYYYQDPFFINAFQYLLDYPVAFGLVGAAGFFIERENSWKIYVGIIAGLMGRFFAHFASGVIFFQIFMKQANVGNPWVYSAVYNATFIIPTGIVCCIIVPYMVRRFRAFRR